MQSAGRGESNFVYIRVFGVTRAILTFFFIDSGPPSPLPGTTPPSAVERFASNNTKSAGDSMSDSNDSILGRDYVVVEKRTVEINALADGELRVILAIRAETECFSFRRARQRAKAAERRRPSSLSRLPLEAT